MPIVDWNGTDVPEGLKKLPAGRYFVESVEDALTLATEEQEGVLAGLRDARDGRTIADAEVQADVERILER